MKVQGSGFEVRCASGHAPDPRAVNRAARPNRRGVLLLVVLSLLVLFMLIGTAFLMSSNQYRQAAKDSAKLNRLGSPPTTLLDRALMQVLRDTGSPTSAVGKHSLLRDMYGSEGFEAVVYSPIDSMLDASFPTGTAAQNRSQITRYAMPTNMAAPNPPLGPTNGQLIDIYVRELAFLSNDPLTPGINEASVTFPVTVPDARHVLKLEPSVLGVPEMYKLPITKGYFNGCLLTVASGPARGQSTRIIDYEYVGDLVPTASNAPAPYSVKSPSRLFRFRVMAFPGANGGPLLTRNRLPNTDARYSNDAARGQEIADLVTEERDTGGTIIGSGGVSIVVSGRPFNGTGAGYNELAVAGTPRLTARDSIRLGTVTAPTPGSAADELLHPEIALAPNPAYFFLSDPANGDLWGPRYRTADSSGSVSYPALNPTSIPFANRPLLWKYQKFSGPGDADESYDAADFQNMALALQTVSPRARGRVVQGAPTNPATLEVDSTLINGAQFLRLDLEDLPLPSFHRPDLINYWFHRLIRYAADSRTGNGTPDDDDVLAVLQPYGPDGIRDNADDPGVAVEIRDQIVALKRKISLRPLREDHPNFDGGNPSSRPRDLSGESNLVRNNNITYPFWEAVGPWDVDNDGDGVPDSVWVDLGDPVTQAEDGTLYKPLYAFLIVDLDSRLNVNAHGLVDHLQVPPFPQLDATIDASNSGPGNLAHDLNAAGVNTSNYLASGSGYGPAEISLRPVLSRYLPGNLNPLPGPPGRTYQSAMGNPAYDDYARLLYGRPATDIPGLGEQNSVWGRHGSVDVRKTTGFANWQDDNAARFEALKSKPGIPYPQTAPFVPGQLDPTYIDRLAVFKFFGYPVWLTDYYGDLVGFPQWKVPSAFSNPPDLRGRYATGLDYVGQPVVEAAIDTPRYNVPLLVDSPYELNLSDPQRRDAPDPSVAATLRVANDAALEDDAPFATADLERILRAYDADAGVLPDRLWNVVDAFDPLKLVANQPDAVRLAATDLFQTSNPDAAQRLAAAQQMASVNRRLVTTDSYDLPVPGSSFLKRLVYGADGQPGVAGMDDDDGGSGQVDEPEELGWQNSDDWYAVMYRGQAGYFNGSGAPTPPPGVRLAPENPTIVDMLRYRIQYERGKVLPAVPNYTEAKLTEITQELLAPELLAGRKMDLNRPFGDGEDNAGNGIDDDGDGFIDATDFNGNGRIDGVDANNNGLIDEREEAGTTDNRNGIVDEPAEVGEPFLDANGDGRWNAGEKWIDVDADGEYDPPRDQLWLGLVGEPVMFDYTNGNGEPIHPDAANPPAIPLTARVRNLNSQARQLYARQLYCLMMLLVDENYLEMPDIPSLEGNSLNLELLLVKIAQDNGNPPFAATDPDKLIARRKLTAQRIAQWAVNVVDFRDADSIMTAFEYDENPWDGWGCPDSSNPKVNIPLDGDVGTDENLGQYIDWENVRESTGGNPPEVPPAAATNPPAVADQTRGVVWGAERPELLITETLAFHDRRCTDEQFANNLSILDNPQQNQSPDYDLDQRLKPRGSLYVELYNPWTPDGPKPREMYGSVPTSGVPDQGVMLNRLSDTADPVSGKFSPVWRMTVLRDPLNGRLPVFRNPATKKLDSGVLKMEDDSTTADVEGYPVPPDPNDKRAIGADRLTIDPDGYGLVMDEHAERHVYFTTGRNYETGVGSDADRSDDDSVEYEPLNPNSTGDWQFKDPAGAILPTPVPVVNQLNVRVPPISFRKVSLKDPLTGALVERPVPISKRYFIARNERIRDPANPTPNDVDITIAPILPGRYAVVGSSGLQLRGTGTLTARAEDLQTTERFVLPISRDLTQPEDGSGDAQLFGRLPGMRRIELWPNPPGFQPGNPNVQQVLVAENGGPEFIRVNNNAVVNVTDSEPAPDGNPTNNPLLADSDGDGTVDAPIIAPAVAIPVEDLNISEPVEGYPSVTYQRLYDMNTPVDANGNPVPLPVTELAVTPEGDLEFRDPSAPTTPLPYDRPLDTDFELVRNGTTQNYRSIHLQRLANPTLPWNPPAVDSAGVPHPLHRPWLPVNPYRTIDSQSSDITAYNGASALERTNLPVQHTQFSEDLNTDLLQSNILAPITATQFLDGPDHELWSIILLLKLKEKNVGNSPEELRGAGQTDINNIENLLNELEEIEPTSRALLTRMVQEVVTPPRQPKFRDGMQQGWHWHMYRRVLPDDQIPNSTPNAFRQWMHFKSLERGFHASNYFKYPKPGAFYAATDGIDTDGDGTPDEDDDRLGLEGWAPDLSVLPRSLWKQERPNARQYVKGAAGSPIVDASDLQTVTSRRILSNTTLTPEERDRIIPDAKIERNRLIWRALRASSSGNEAVFDFVLEQTLGFANESFAPDLERANAQVRTAVLDVGRPGAPEVGTTSANRRPADPVTFAPVTGLPLKEVRNGQRQAAVLQGSNAPTAQPSLLQEVVDNGTLSGTVETELVDEFYKRREFLMKSTFPWLKWNDRPLVSAEEILQVPAAASSLMLRDYSLPSIFTPNAYDGNRNHPPFPGGLLKTTLEQLAAQHAPFGHLLNFFLTSASPAISVTNPVEPTGAPNFYRILEFVEVPSRYVGTETLLSPEVFNDNPLDATDNMVGPTDPRINLQPPFNTVSRQRDPGRVNLNTVTGRRTPPTFNAPPRSWSDVYDGIMNRYADNALFDNTSGGLLQLGQFGPAWRDVVLSRKGYAQFNADDPGLDLPLEKRGPGAYPDVFAFGLNPGFPTMFANPFRSSNAGDLVPLLQMMQYGVDASWLRVHPRVRAEDGAWGVGNLDDGDGIDNDGNGLVDDPIELTYPLGDSRRDPLMNGLVDDATEAGWGDDIISHRGNGLFRPVPEEEFDDPDREMIPLFSETTTESAVDALRNPGMMYQPMTRLGNLVTTRSNVYAVWVTVGYFEVEPAPDWNSSDDAVREAVRAKFGGTTNDGDDATIRARALYDRVYPEGYSLGQELGSDTGNTRRHRAFYIIDRTEPVGFKPGEDLNVDKMIRVRRRIE